MERRWRNRGDGPELDHPYYLGLLGDALGRTAQAEEGLAVLEEAIELVGTARPFYYLPDRARPPGALAELRRRYDQFEEGFATPTCRPPGRCSTPASRAGAGGPGPR